MNKIFKEINVGDKIYVISIQDSKFKMDKDEPFMKTCLVTSRGSSSNPAISLDNRAVFFPNPHDKAHVFFNSYDTTGYSKINSTVYGTSKRDCLETAIQVINESDRKQRETIHRLRELLDTNANMVKVLEAGLENADMPDTMLEFAEMALT